MLPSNKSLPRTPSTSKPGHRGNWSQQVALRPLTSAVDRKIREQLRRSVIPLDDDVVTSSKRYQRDTLPKRVSLTKSRSIPELWKLENLDFFRESDFDSFGSSCDDPVQAYRVLKNSEVLAREQPIFSTKAHVFHIDPKTKRSWIPASSHAVTVSFFYDLSRSLYRIISVEGSKPVINSSIAPSMTFTKTSQKFGQWSDIRANTVYGLGFQTEADLNLFIEKFQEVKDKTRFVQQKQNGNSSNSPSSTLVRGGSGTASSQSAAAAAAAAAVAAHAAPGGHQAQVSAAAAAVLEPANEDSPKHKPVSQLPQSTVEAQLRYENDRLKLALAQSSANAKKWEIELQTLKNNNARLTCALQESTANVEEWKRQLQSLKDDNTKLRCRVLEYEASHGNQEAVSELGAELNQLRQRNEYLNAELLQRDKDLESLRSSTSSAPSDRVKAMLAENDTLRMSVSRLQEQLESVRISGSKQPALEQLSNRLGMQIAELRELHVELASLLLVPPPQSHGQPT